MNNVPAKPAYCETLVRTHDPDRFLISLFSPAAVRADLWALYAFNHEIAKTREVVTDTHIGLIRLQWWRDALADIYERNKILNHEIVAALAPAIQHHHLPRDLFDHLIYAREFDLEDRQPGSLDGLCNYADYTHTPLLRLSARVAGENADHPAVQPVAIAYALAGLIRAVPFYLAQGRCMLPEDLMRREGLNFGTLQISRDLSALRPVTRLVREKAEDILRQADRKNEPRLIRLHRVMAQQYLSRIKSLGDNCFHPRLGFAPPLRVAGLWLSAQKS